MKLQNIGKLVIIGLVAGIMTGCGGGSSIDTYTAIDTITDTSTTPKTIGCQVAVSDGERDITIKAEENIVIGWGCSKANIYDTDGNHIAGNYNDVEPIILSQGDYSVIYDNGRNSTRGDPIGVVYYLSSNIYLENLPLNEKINIPGRTANIHKLNVSQESTYTLKLLDATIVVYDSLLNRTDSFSSRNSTKTESISLVSGTYYVLSSPYTSATYCTDGTSASFSLTKL